MKIAKYNTGAKKWSLSDFDFENIDFVQYFLSKKAKEDLKKAKDLSCKFSKKVDYLIVVGVGGSILGSRALIEAFGKKNVYFCGNSLDFSQFNDILQTLNGKSYGVCYISKSGTTLESSLFFELVCQTVDKDNVVVISDKDSPAHVWATEKGYHFLEIPKCVGGRFSTLTAVGAFPVFFAGINFDKIFKGYIEQFKTFIKNKNNSPEIEYVVARVNAEEDGKRIEVFASFENFYQKLLPVFVQLVGESLGKNGKGLYPTSCNFTEDLHAVGQYIQEGRKSFLEIIICSKKFKKSSKIEEKYIKYNKIALNSTIQAHNSAGNSMVIIEIEKQDEISVGRLFAFMQIVVIASGFLTNVNPVGQSGVENYKTNMKTQITKLKNK